MNVIKVDYDANVMFICSGSIIFVFKMTFLIFELKLNAVITHEGEARGEILERTKKSDFNRFI